MSAQRFNRRRVETESARCKFWSIVRSKGANNIRAAGIVDPNGATASVVTVNPAIRVDGLSKRFSLAPTPLRALREMIWPKSARSEVVSALHDVSFSISPGECVGLVGSNGAGKSTLLRVLTETLSPTDGTVEVNGRVRAVLDLGAGFHEEATGRENVMFGGLCLGDSRAELEQNAGRILEFAGVVEAADRPFRTYSTGMRGRLMFAVAFWRPVEILMVDEALATGDEAFVRQCTQHIEALCSGGSTAILASHSLEMIERLCERWIYLKEGKLVADGEAAWVRALYEEDLGRTGGEIAPIVAAEPDPAANEIRGPEPIPAASTSADSTEGYRAQTQFAPSLNTRTLVGPLVAVEDSVVATVCAQIEATSGVATRDIETGQAVCFVFDIECSRALPEVELRVSVTDARGFSVASCTSSEVAAPLSLAEGCNRFELQLPSLDLGAGHYLLGLALHNGRRSKATGAASDEPRFSCGELVAFSVRRAGLLQDVPYEPPSNWGALDRIGGLSPAVQPVEGPA